METIKTPRTNETLTPIMLIEECPDDRTYKSRVIFDGKKIDTIGECLYRCCLANGEMLDVIEEVHFRLMKKDSVVS